MNLTIILPWTTVLVADSTVLYYPGNLWRPTGRITGVRATLELATEVGTDIEVCAGVQRCNTPDVPGALIPIGAYLTTPDVQYPTGWTDVISDFEQALNFRCGYLAKRVNGSGLVVARVQATFEFNGC